MRNTTDHVPNKTVNLPPSLFLLLEGIPYNLASLGHVFLSPFVDQEKTRLCSTTKSCWLASETLTPGFRQTQEITLGLDALIIAKIGKIM